MEYQPEIPGPIDFEDWLAITLPPREARCVIDAFNDVGKVIQVPIIDEEPSHAFLLDRIRGLSSLKRKLDAFYKGGRAPMAPEVEKVVLDQARGQLYSLVQLELGYFSEEIRASIDRIFGLKSE